MVPVVRFVVRLPVLAVPGRPEERGRPALGWRTVAPASFPMPRAPPSSVGARRTRNYIRGSSPHCARWPAQTQAPRTTTSRQGPPEVVPLLLGQTQHAVVEARHVPSSSPGSTPRPPVLPSSSPAPRLRSARGTRCMRALSARRCGLGDPGATLRRPHEVVQPDGPGAQARNYAVESTGMTPAAAPGRRTVRTVLNEGS